MDSSNSLENEKAASLDSEANASSDRDTIENKYKVVKEIGRGNTSCVYLVNHLFLNKQLAIKVFKDKYWENEKRFTRAQREAETLASLDHDNVVKVFDFGVTEDGAPYIVQEFVSGEDLKTVINTNGAMDQNQAIKIFIQIAEGLNCLHENHILHRDIKSQNIIINESNGTKRIKLIDLGIARPEDKDGAIQSLTQSGTHVGSPYYMSPEMCKGGEIDSRADIYSLGCVMYEVLTGILPFRAETALKTLEMHINETQKPLSEFNIGSRLEEIVNKCLAKDPESRYQSCQELIDSLKKLAGIKTGQKVSKPLIALLLAVPVLIAVFLGVNQTFSNSSKKETPAKKVISDDSTAHDLILDHGNAIALMHIGAQKQGNKYYRQAVEKAIRNKASDVEICSVATSWATWKTNTGKWEEINRGSVEI